MLGVNEVTSETFKISMGITLGIVICFGLKKSGRPTANNKIDKWKKREKYIPRWVGLELSR